jgi:hypothetical protein
MMLLLLQTDRQTDTQVPPFASKQATLLKAITRLHPHKAGRSQGFYNHVLDPRERDREIERERDKGWGSKRLLAYVLNEHMLWYTHKSSQGNFLLNPLPLCTFDTLTVCRRRKRIRNEKVMAHQSKKVKEVENSKANKTK